MKKINYNRLFTQKLRENGVIGIFCEKASEELLCLLYSKKDTWNEATNYGTTFDRVWDIAKELENEGEERVMEAVNVVRTIWEVIN